MTGNSIASSAMEGGKERDMSKDTCSRPFPLPLPFGGTQRDKVPDASRSVPAEDFLGDIMRQAERLSTACGKGWSVNSPSDTDGLPIMLCIRLRPDREGWRLTPLSTRLCQSRARGGAPDE